MAAPEVEPMNPASSSSDDDDDGGGDRREDGAPATKRLPVRCTDCGLVVAYAALARHRKLHNTGSDTHQSFPCNKPGCTKTFARRHDLARHEATHGGADGATQPVFTCDECDYSTPRLDNLHRHQKNHLLVELRETIRNGEANLAELRAQLRAAESAKVAADLAAAQTALMNEDDDAAAAAAAEEKEEEEEEGVSDEEKGKEGEEEEEEEEEEVATTAAAVVAAAVAAAVEAGDLDPPAPEASDAAGSTRSARSRALRCATCHETGAASGLAAVVRCARPACAAPFHWTCAQYIRTMTVLTHLALCGACQTLTGLPAPVLEATDVEVEVLDAHLARRRLRRVLIDADGLCLFRALLASMSSTSWTPDGLVQATMAAVAAHPWGDTMDAATLRVALPQARTLAQRSLRVGVRWDRGLFDLVFAVLPTLLGGPIAMYRLHNGRSLGGEHPADAVARVCCYHRAVGYDHYDAVVAIRPSS